jgi:hypothetical protein
MAEKNGHRPPQPVHVAGTGKGEERVIRRGREPGRKEGNQGFHRTTRDSTSINPKAHRPIDPDMPYLPPP